MKKLEKANYFVHISNETAKRQEELNFLNSEIKELENQTESLKWLIDNSNNVPVEIIRMYEKQINKIAAMKNKSKIWLQDIKESHAINHSMINAKRKAR